jgi:asparagine synthase (glutamine-hydrolysing)
MAEGALYAERDLAGTRPLFVGESGEWVASDHRFFRGEASHLLPPGSRLEVQAGRVETLAPLQREPPSSFDEAARAVADLLDQSIRERTQGRRKVGIAFSGGLDSSILARVASKYVKVVACSVYAPGSQDKVKASRGAECLGLDLATEELDRRDVASELSMMDIPFEPSPMDKSLWCIYSVAARAAAEAGGEVIMLGQLADELFGGYLKYQKAAENGGPGVARKMMEGDVVECGKRGLIRDEAACSRWLEPRFPFADGRLLKLGLSLPVGFKIRHGVRKALLREAAKMLGVPDELTSSPKKAAQYSSGILKLVD